MMEATYKAFGGRLVVKFTASSVKELFEQVGAVAEVLDADQVCGKCGSPEIYPRVRTAQGQYDYYELNCAACEARLSFGQNKDQAGLFAKRTDEHGKALDHHGWYIYRSLPPASIPHNNAAPKPNSASATAQPSTQPRPGGGPSPAPGYSRLDSFLRRIKDRDTAQAVIMDVYDLLVMGTNQEEADAIWAAAVQKCGDPALKLEAAPNVVRELYKGIMAAEEKARAS
jgi:hypothetical protein